jgi:8-oxo-dGTP pyrophosphatase MutT (NUDIX family)
MAKETRSAGGVVFGPDNKVIIVSQHGLSWSLPKGHIEDGEDLLTAAKREIEEETGVTSLEYIDHLVEYSRYKLAKNGDDDNSELKIITLFVFRTDEVVLNPQDPDNPDARWVDIDEASAYLTHKIDRQQYIDHIPRLKEILASL